MNKLFTSRKSFTWDAFPYNTLVTQFKDGSTQIFYYDNSLISGLSPAAISDELRKQAVEYLDTNYPNLWSNATIKYVEGSKSEDQIALETLYSN